jgi:hypothetical protein
MWLSPCDAFGPIRRRSPANSTRIRDSGVEPAISATPPAKAGIAVARAGARSRHGFDTAP